MEVRRLAKQLFWLLFFVTMILLLVGWQIASSRLQASITKRTTDLMRAFDISQIDVKSVPNEQWFQKADAINRLNAERFHDSVESLFARQLDARSYPEELTEQFRQIRFGTAIDDKALRQRYRQVFQHYFNRQLSMIQPFDGTTGLVDLSSAAFEFDQSFRRHKRPQASQIWHAQEDVWLMSSVFDAIRAVNERCERIDRASVRALERIQLRGGTRNSGRQSMGDHRVSVSFANPRNGFFGPRATTATSENIGVWTAFTGSSTEDQLSELFGPQGTAGFIEQRAFSAFDVRASMTKGEDLRYVDQDPSLPYRTRAAAVTVRITQNKIPEFLAALVNGTYPFEIMSLDVTFGNSRSASRNAQSHENTASPRKDANPQARRFHQIALNDRQLCRLRVAGLMLIYQSPE